MKNRQAASHRQRLDNLFALFEAFLKDPEVKPHWARYHELQSHWAIYLCVLTSGFLEASVREIYGHYASEKAAPNVANFVLDRLEGFQNPKMEKILELTKSFNRGWESDLRVATEGEIKDAVDSIVANRHLIAHGRPVGITYVRIKNYYENAVKVIDLIERQCTGSTRVGVT